MSGPASNERYQKIVRDRDKTGEAQVKADIRAVMNHPAGRRFVWWILQGLSRVGELSYTGNSDTYFREGQRSVGIVLRDEVLRVDSANFVHMLNESYSAEREEESIRREAEAVAKSEAEE